MSALFNFLSYLSGFLFFLILIKTAGQKSYIKKILFVLLLSTSLSLSFGFFQLLKGINIGNTPLRFQMGTLNSTFKDPNSYGVYLAAIIPLILSIIFIFKKWAKIVPVIILAFCFLILPYTGSLSGLLGSFIGVLSFILMTILIAVRSKESAWKSLKKIIAPLCIFLLIIGIAVAGYFSSKEYVSFAKLKLRISILEKGMDLGVFTSYRYSYFWAMAAEIIKDYPFSGVGIGAYIIELPNYAHLYNSRWRTSDSAENYFFQVGSELGILALLCSLWIFWEIFRQMRKTFRAYSQIDRWNYLIAGLSAGIIAIIVNFFFHTYIGSYEIIYTFWLFVGLLFCLGLSEQEQIKKPNLNRNSIIVGAVIIVIFGGTLLWNSTHSLSLKSRSELLGIRQDFGFYQPEKTKDGREFRWTRQYGGLQMKIEKPVIAIPLLASHPDLRLNPVKVKIFIIKEFFKQKNLLKELVLDWNAWETHEFYLPEEVGQEVILLFKVSRTWNPLKRLGTPDPRSLGVAVGRIEFKDKQA